MIADLDETLRRLLIAELPVKNGEIDIQFDQPKREWSSRLTRPTINLFLYDLRENSALRQHAWERLPPNGNGGNQGIHKRTPLRVDCFYMLTTWANEPDDEHRLLARSLTALFRFPLLPRDRLVGSLEAQQYDVQARLAQHDRLTNPAEVWSALDNEMRPSISYVITLALDPWSPVPEGPLVRTLTLRSGQRVEPYYRRRLHDETVEMLIDLGGTVRRKGEPASGVSVAIKGTGLFATSDEDGRFTFGSLSPGDYTLVAWPVSGEVKPREKKITLPPEPDGPDGNYDLEL